MPRKKRGPERKIRCSRRVCRKTFITFDPMERYCSSDCATLFNQELRRPNIPKRECKYHGCSKTFPPQREDQYYCTALCRLSDYAQKFLTITAIIPRELLTGESQDGTIILEIRNGRIYQMNGLPYGAEREVQK